MINSQINVIRKSVTESVVVVLECATDRDRNTQQCYYYCTLIPDWATTESTCSIVTDRYELDWGPSCWSEFRFILALGKCFTCSMICMHTGSRSRARYQAAISCCRGNWEDTAVLLMRYLSNARRLRRLYRANAQQAKLIGATRNGWGIAERGYCSMRSSGDGHRTWCCCGDATCTRNRRVCVLVWLGVFTDSSKNPQTMIKLAQLRKKLLFPTWFQVEWNGLKTRLERIHRVHSLLFKVNEWTNQTK